MYAKDLQKDKERRMANEKALEDIKKQYQDSDEKYILNFVDLGDEEIEP